SRIRHTRFSRDWSSDVCSSDLGVGQQQHEAIDLITIDTGDLQDHIDARPPQLAARDNFQRTYPTTAIPYRAQTQRMQYLAFENTQMAHGLGRPEAESEFGWRLAIVLVAIGLQQLLQSLLTGVIGAGGRQLVGLEGIQVAATGHLRIAYRIAARPRGDEATGQSGQQRLDLAGLGQVLLLLARR